jgi:hypothetical protein
MNFFSEQIGDAPFVCHVGISLQKIIIVKMPLTTSYQELI